MIKEMMPFMEDADPNPVQEGLAISDSPTVDDKGNLLKKLMAMMGVVNSQQEGSLNV